MGRNVSNKALLLAWGSRRTGFTKSTRRSDPMFIEENGNTADTEGREGGKIHMKLLDRNCLSP